MQVRDMSESDLLGALFVLYPTDVPTDMCRERLEMEIAIASANADHVDCDDKEPCISPYWIRMVMRCRKDEWLRTTPISERRRALDILWRFRCHAVTMQGMKNVRWSLYRLDDENDSLQLKQPKMKTNKTKE